MSIDNPIATGGIRANKTRQNTAHQATDSLRVPSVPLALGDKNVGSLFMVGNDLYLGTGTRSTKIAAGSPITGAIRLSDYDGDTYVQVDNGLNNNKVILAAPGAAPNAITINATNAAGGIDIDAGATSGGITMDAGGSIALTAGLAGNGIVLSCTNASGNINILSGLSGSILLNTILGDCNVLASSGNITLDAGKQTFISGCTLGYGTISSATTVTAFDSGKLHEVTAGAGYTITLPAPSFGTWFRFMLVGNGALVNITSTGANIYGTVHVNSPTTALSAAGVTKVNFAGVAALGSHIELFGTTSKYLLRAASFTAAGITLTP